MIESTFPPNKEILPPAQKELWSGLHPACEMGFVLYGGTAIALRLGHRVSVDFDLFTEKSLKREEVGEAFPFLGRSTVLQDEKILFLLFTSSSQGSGELVKVSFLEGLDLATLGFLNRPGMMCFE